MGPLERTRRFTLAALVAAALGPACDSADDGTGGRATSSSSTSTSTGAPTTGLGMNDVTFLLPLPKTDAPVLFRASDPVADNQAILPKALVDQVLDTPTNPGAIGNVYPDLELVAVRFDLCDRAKAEPCPDTEDARLRLVFQPIVMQQAFDVGFHVFYEIPKADIPAVLDELRALADSQHLPPATALRVNPLVGVDAAYTAGLRALVEKRCVSSAIVRVTVMGQELTAAALRWIFHGIERKAGTFQEIPVAEGSDAVQEVLLLGESSYDITPKIDAPAGFQLAMDESAFAAAPAAQQEIALDALAQVNHPTKNVPNTVQCAACHVATLTLSARASAAKTDPNALPSAFQSGYDTSVSAGESAKDGSILRGLGWRGTTLAISQRVANETAEVLQEISARF
ncbi:MAG: hypothetical protein U0414_12925 [Polyangiaceae bacterium]